MLDLKQIIPQKNSAEDDFKILRTWVEYSSDRKYAQGLMYEFEMEDESGNIHHLFKCVKLIRVVRLPKSAKQSNKTMQTHARLLQAVWQRNIKLVTVIANILTPVPFGLMYLYGTQSVAQTEDEAREMAKQDYTTLVHLLQGSYRVLELAELTYQELEWLREKMFSMKNMTVVRGIPKAKGGGDKKQGAEVAYGVNTSMDEEDTTEEFIAGMSNREYVVQILSTPVKAEHLERWLAQTAQEMTRFNSQLKGTSNIGFNLSIPMMFMANVGATDGWNHSYTESQVEGVTLSESLQTSFSTSIGESAGTSYGETLSHSNGSSWSENVGENYSSSIGSSDGSSWSDGIGTSQGTSNSYTEGLSGGTSYGEGLSNSNTHTDGTSVNITDATSQTITNSQDVSHGSGTTVTESDGTSDTTSVTGTSGWSSTESTSSGTSEQQSVTTSDTTKESLTETQSTSTQHSTTSVMDSSSSMDRSKTNSNGSSFGTSIGRSSSEDDTEIFLFWNRGTSSSSSVSFAFDSSDTYSTSHNESRGFGHSDSTTTGWGDSTDNSVTIDNSRSHQHTETVGVDRTTTDSFGTSGSHSEGNAHTTSNTTNLSRGTNSTTSDGYNTGYGTTLSNGSGFGSNDSSTHGTGENWQQSANESENKSHGNTSNISRNASNGGNSSVSSSDSWGMNRGSSYGETSTDSYSRGANTSVVRTFSESNGVSQGSSWGSSSTNSRGQNFTTNGSMTRGTNSSLGFGPSVGFGITYQWIDQEVKNILTMLDFQNTRLMSALSGATGAFFTDVYIATPDKKAQEAAAILAKGSWMDDAALVCPLQVLNLKDEEQKHLLYHFSAFSADNAKINDSHQMQSYKYSTILLPLEYTAYTHLPRISDGGVFADVGDVPKFAVPSMRKGDIYMGKILSGERWTIGDKYESIFEYRLDESELMHGIFTGESRSGKTVAATRFVVELTKLRRRKTGKRLRIVALDPKQDWRILAKFVEPERFHFYSLGNPEFRPINLNICKVPKNVNPQVWVDGIIDIFCRSYGLLERGKAILGESFYALYDEAGVFEDSPDWRDFVPERSARVTMAKIYERMLKIKVGLDEELVATRGRMGNEAMDAYMCLLDRLQVFGRKFSIEARLFSKQDGIAVDELIGQDDIIVLESYGLETTFKNFIFGCITSGFFKYAQGHEGGFLAPDQYETVLIIEEANEVLTGSDTAGGGGSMPSLSGQSEFERILDQAAGLGLFIIAITQKIADMPSSCVANSGLIFAGKISRADDVSLVVRKIARDERYDDRDILKWFPRSPIGWFVCRSSRNFDFKESEPVLVHIDPLGVDPPNNAELDGILFEKEAMRLLAT